MELKVRFVLRLSDLQEDMKEDLSGFIEERDLSKWSQNAAPLCVDLSFYDDDDDSCAARIARWIHDRKMFSEDTFEVFVQFDQ